ncbi:MAG: aminopeptidase, partial [Acidobacteriota bacterium]|nr:aminopeptidase [Acidobacteriota bacterium]
MIDADAYAVLIAEWCLDVRPDQQVLIETTTLAQEPAVALHRAVLERGGWPLLRLAPARLEAD